MEPNLEEFKANWLKIRTNHLDPIACYILGFYSAIGCGTPQYYNLMISGFKKVQDIQCSEEDRVTLLFDLIQRNYGKFSQDYTDIQNKTQNLSLISSQVNSIPSQVHPIQTRVNSIPSQVKPIPSQVNPIPSQVNPIPSQVNPIPAPRQNIPLPRQNVPLTRSEPREEYKNTNLPNRLFQPLNQELVKIIGLNPTIRDDISVQPIRETQYEINHQSVYSKFNSQLSAANSRPLENQYFPNSQSNNSRAPVMLPPGMNNKICLFCRLAIPRDQEYSLTCGHIYHGDCAIQLILSATLNNIFPARCGCDIEIPDDIVSTLIPPEDFRKYTLLRNPIREIPVRKYCQKCKQEYFGDHVCTKCDHRSQKPTKSFIKSAVCICGAIICLPCQNEMKDCSCPR